SCAAPRVWPEKRKAQENRKRKGWRGRTAMTKAGAGNAATRRDVLRSAAATFAIGDFSATARAATNLTAAKVAEDFALMMGDFGAKLGIHKRNGLDLDF